MRRVRKNPSDWTVWVSHPLSGDTSALAEIEAGPFNETFDEAIDRISPILESYGFRAPNRETLLEQVADYATSKASLAEAVFAISEIDTRLAVMSILDMGFMDEVWKSAVRWVKNGPTSRDPNIWRVLSSVPQSPMTEALRSYMRERLLSVPRMKSYNLFSTNPSLAVRIFLDAVEPSIDADTLEIVRESAQGISSPEAGDPTYITYLLEEIKASENLYGEGYYRPGYWEPEVEFFDAATAAEFVEPAYDGEEGLEGWYGRMQAPGYLDASDWEGPYVSEEEAMEALSDAYGPFELSESTQWVIDFLEEAWRIYRDRVAGYQMPEDGGERLRKTMERYADRLGLPGYVLVRTISG